MTDEKVEIENITEAFDYIRSNVPDETAEQIIERIHLYKKPATYLKLECRRCGHEWTVRKSLKPKVCPECESPRLDQGVIKSNTHNCGTLEENIDEDGNINP